MLLLAFQLIYVINYVLCVFVFFFFKQKTAYEMRISDWSSDVCSSDLVLRCIGQALAAPQPVENARRECVAGPDPVDHRGDEGGIACAARVAGIDGRGDPVGVRAKDFARGRGDMFERGEMIE